LLGQQAKDIGSVARAQQNVLRNFAVWFANTAQYANNYFSDRNISDSVKQQLNE